MLKRRINNLIERICKNNSGTTLIEMIVSFALLGIFMACSSMIIATIANTYYEVKGETFGSQVSDIILEKIESEIDGAKYFGEDMETGNPSITNNTSITLFDKTYTHVTVGSKDKKLTVKYSAIVYNTNGEEDDDKSLSETTWQFDDSVYNGFMIEELKFYKNNDTLDSDTIKAYGLSDINLSKYGDNVVLVLLHLKSDRYGDYYCHRFVKMYNVPAVKAPSESNP